MQELKPKLHVFGHIHEARGAYLHRWKAERDRLGAQNSIQLGIKSEGVAATEVEVDAEEAQEFEEYSDESDGESVDYGPILFEPSTGKVSHAPVVDAGVLDEEETIFVNAANWPSGPNARRTGMRLKMGGETFQPIIVDLLDL